MKKTPLLSVTLSTLLLTAMCACSNDKNANRAEAADTDSIQAVNVQDSIPNDTVAAEAPAKLDAEAMKAVVKKLFNASEANEVLALMSEQWRAKYEKRWRNVGAGLLSSGGDEWVQEGSMNITSANPEDGIVTARAILESPDPEDGTYEEKASYTFKIVKEGDKHLIDDVEFKTNSGGLKNGGFDL